MKLIPLSRGKFAKVDDDVYEQLYQYKWYAHPIKPKYSSEIIYYARRHYHEDKKKKSVYMHRLILNIHDDKTKIVDHADHDGLNNQISNLRIATKRQNAINQRPMRGASKYMGVSYRYWFNKSGKQERWVAQIQLEKGKRKFIGSFNYTKAGEAEAAKQYDLVAKQVYKEFANLNFKD